MANLSDGRPDQVSGFAIWVVLMLGIILSPFYACGKMIGLIDEDAMRPKVWVNEHGQRCGRDRSAAHCQATGYRYWKGEYKK